MTDTAPTADKLVTLTTFDKASIWLPRMALEHLRVGVSVIEGKTFTDCVLEGPAVIMSIGGVEFMGCAMGVAGDPKNLLLRPVGDKVSGVIAFRNCKFERCRFMGIGFAGDEAFIHTFSGVMDGSISQPGAAPNTAPETTQ